MFRQNKIASAVLFTVILCLGWSKLSAKELTGQEILNKVDRNATPNTQIMAAEMTIINRQGAKRIRKVKIWMKGDDYTLAKFLYPADIKGTGFLSAKDDQWLYLPVLRKVRRIASKQRNESFMGSDFSYDDVARSSLGKKYNAKLLSVEKFEKDTCYVLELIPKDLKDLNYSKLKTWIKKENFYSVKTEYYDKHGDLVKIMQNSNIEKIDDFLIATTIEMQNVQKESKTILVFNQIQLNSKISDEVFTTRYLERQAGGV